MKITSLKQEAVDLQSVVDKANTEKRQQSLSVTEISDKYLMMVKSLRAEMQGLKTMSSE